MGKIPQANNKLASLSTGKGVVFLICKDSSKSVRNRNNPDAKLASKEDEQTVPRQEEQMVLRHVKRRSASLIEEM